MSESSHKATIKIFAMPMEACDPRKTWKAAFQHLAKRLYERYGDLIEMEFIEIFSPESFRYLDIMKMVEEVQAKPPYVMIDDRLISSGGKLSEPAIHQTLDLTIGKSEALETSE